MIYRTSEKTKNLSNLSCNGDSSEYIAAAECTAPVTSRPNNNNENIFMKKVSNAKSCLPSPAYTRV